MERNVIQSANDRKLYRYVDLENGLSVLLIHDPAVAEALEAQPTSQDGDEIMESAEAGSQDTDSKSAEDSSSDEDSSESGSEGSDEEGSEHEHGNRAKGSSKAAGCKKAAAAMAVGVGSFSDPAEMQGLSHYLEHMLFMGSEKYPDENEYDSYLTKNGGSSNAFTELEFTNYHFDVAPAALEGALDRFAQFFVAPLFQASALEREVQAVDSEFMGVLQSDHSRLAQLMCHTSKPGHIYNKFSWGNLKSLWEQPREAGINVREHIISYYRQQYGPVRMSLVLLGGQPLDQLEAWVRQMLGSVPRGTVGPPATFSKAGQPFEGRHLYIVPAVKEHHEVTVTLQLPCLRDQYTSKPDHYISHLVGHEGPGSLLSALKARGWAVELCAGVDDDGYSANTAVYLFSVNIVLTEAGLAAGPGFGLAPVALLFQYLKLLRTTGPQEWVWEEIKSIADMKFRFLEEEDSCDLVTRLASTMTWVAPEHLLVADYLHQQWQPDKVLELLSCMDPVSSSFRIDLLTKSFSELKEQLLAQHAAAQDNSNSGNGTNSSLFSSNVVGGTVISFTEPWFNMEALSIQLPDDLTASWRDAESADDLALPPQNPYIPSNFELKTESQPAADDDDTGNGPQQPQQEQDEIQGLEGLINSWMLIEGDAAKPSMLLAQPPAMLVDEPGLRVWHKLALSYQQPRMIAYFRLSSPAAAASPAATVLGVLWLRLVEEALAEDAYLADVAGLHWSGSGEGLAGFEVRMDGFSHKLDVLAARVFEALARCEMKEARFSAVHEQLLRRYKNALLQPAKAASAARLRCLSGGPHWSYDQLVEALEQVKGVDKVKAYVQELLSCCHLECLLLGNITAAEATALSRKLQSSITKHNSSNTCSKLTAADRPQEQCVKLPDGVVLLHREAARNPEEENCCVEVYYQVGLSSTDLKLRVLTDLADQILYEPLYDSLRTKQQLGYTVSSGARLTHGVSGFCVVVVSAAFAAAEVEQRIEGFLEDYQQAVMDMSADEFDRHKSALSSNKLQKDTALHQEGDRMWEQIFNCRYEFLCKEQEVAVLQSITLKDFQQYYTTYLAPGSKQRRKLCVHVFPSKETTSDRAAMQVDGQNQQQQHQQAAQHDGPQQQHQQAAQHDGPQQQHVQHEVGIVTHPRHHVAAGVIKVHAGAENRDVQQQHKEEPDAVSPMKSPKAKRQRQQQHESDSKGTSATAMLPDGMQVQVVGDIDAFKQQCDRYPVYQTVRPVLSQMQ